MVCDILKVNVFQGGFQRWGGVLKNSSFFMLAPNKRGREPHPASRRYSDCLVESLGGVQGAQSHREGGNQRGLAIILTVWRPVGGPHVRSV